MVQTLKNALNRDRVPHGLIFSGIRGTGKTTLARIMAKALNCEQGVTSTPCGDCHSCRDIKAGKAIDIHEIDGASNRGIQEIRDLKERIRFMPTNARYKIIIIDEVHMLTSEAFNALLKTLEEPPDHVYFMFATTELHKVPVTILSRCQRYELQRVSHQELSEHFLRLANGEGFKIDQAAVSIIARESSGSVRDGLSLMDQVFSYCGNEVAAEDVAEVLGLVSHEVIADIGAALLAGDISLAMERLEQVYEYGLNSKRFTADLLAWFRNLVFCRLSRTPEKTLDLAGDELVRLKQVAAQYTVETLSVAFKVLLEGLEKVHYASQPRMALEIAFLQTVQVGDIQPVSELLSRLDSTLAGISLRTDKEDILEKAGEERDNFSLPHEKKPVVIAQTEEPNKPQVVRMDDSLQVDHPATNPSGSSLQQNGSLSDLGGSRVGHEEYDKRVSVRDHGQQEKIIQKPVLAKSESEDIKSRWPEFIRYVRSRNPWMPAVLQRSESAVIVGGELIITYDSPMDYDLFKNREHARLLTEFVLDFFQQTLVVSFNSNGGGECEVDADDVGSPQAARQALAHDPLVLTAVDIFNGQVGSIRVGPRLCASADNDS